jgi:hypothetical protein
MTSVNPSNRDDMDIIKGKLGMGGSILRLEKSKSHSSAKMVKFDRKNSEDVETNASKTRIDIVSTLSPSS